MAQDRYEHNRKTAAGHLLLTFALLPAIAAIVGLAVGLVPVGAHGVLKLISLALPTLLAATAGWLTWAEAGLCVHPKTGPSGVLRLVLVAGLLSMGVLLAGEWFASAMAGRPVSGVRYVFSWGALLGAVPGSAGEELFFRGAVQGLSNRALPGRLTLGSLRLRHGTLVIALAFGLVHLVAGGGAPEWITLSQWRTMQALFGTLFGVIFGYVRDEVGPVWAPAVLHVLVNAQLLALVA